MVDLNSEWQRKGGSLSDKTARKEYGLTQEEIIRAIQAGTLHFRENSIYGYPFFRLLRREVEALVRRKRGPAGLEEQKTRTELAAVNLELKRLKKRVAELNQRKAELTGRLGR